jgi:hypothetical protein
MHIVFGNPKPVYFYDINPSCISYEQKINSTLQLLSASTGISFIKLDHPLALILGGISYSCEDKLTDIRFAGEAETGLVGISYFIVTWNNVRLSSVREDVILHETLHTMGFGHSSNSSSIMYPYAIGNRLNLEIRQMLNYYTFPLFYINVVSTNVMFICLILLYILSFFINK